MQALSKGQRIIVCQSEHYPSIKGAIGTVEQPSERWPGMGWVKMDDPLPDDISADMRAFPNANIIFLHHTECLPIPAGV